MALVIRRYVIVGPTTAQLTLRVDPSCAVMAQVPTTVTNIAVDDDPSIVATLDAFMARAGYSADDTAPSSSSGTAIFYGSGADGPLHVLAGTTFTMDRDYNWTSVIIEPTGILQTNPVADPNAGGGFAIFSTLGVINNGTVVTSAGNGGPGAAGVGGASGGAYGPFVSGSLLKGNTYGAPGGNAGNNGGEGSQGVAYYPTIPLGNSGAGGNSAVHIGGGGPSQLVLAPNYGSIDSLLAAFSSTAFYGNLAISASQVWGSGGGGGAGGILTGGGGGGGDGGIQLIIAPTIIGVGVFLCEGGAGGAGETLIADNAGGGGGGEGGLVVWVTSSGTEIMAGVSVAGGAGGPAGGVGATAGAPGSVGATRQYKVAL